MRTKESNKSPYLYTLYYVALSHMALHLGSIKSGEVNGGWGWEGSISFPSTATLPPWNPLYFIEVWTPPWTDSHIGRILHAFPHIPIHWGPWNTGQEKLSTVILTDQPWSVKCLLTFVLKCPEFIHIPFGDNILHFHWGIFLPHSNLRETVNQGARLMANGWAHDLSQGS